MRPPIAHILPFPGVGGTELATLRLMQAARTHGYASTAVHLAGSPEVGEMFRDHGFPALAYAGVEPSLRHPAAWWTASRQLAAALRAGRFGLIHSAEWLGAYQVSLAATLARVPLITHIRNRYEAISRRDRLFLRPVRRFVFVSQDTRRHFPLPVPESRSTVLYDGLDLAPPHRTRPEVLAEFGLPEDAYLIGMAARVSPQKDYPTLLTAAAAVLARNPRARFLILGDHTRSAAHREHYASLQPQISALNLADRVLFAGFRTDVPRLLDALDLFVLSTHWEGFPLVILEALAHGLPVVATAVDGIPEIITENETGLLHPHADAGALGRQILRMIEEPGLASRLAAAGRALVGSRFSREHFTASVGALYNGFNWA